MPSANSFNQNNTGCTEVRWPPSGTADPGIDMKTPVRDQVEGMDGMTFFTLLATLMKQSTV